MGGAAAGEIASSLAVDEVMRLLTARPEGVPLSDLIEQAISAANDVIYSRSQVNPRLSGMGTTLVALVVEERRVCVVNVGDSRCYRLRDEHLEQISQDHSLVEEQVRIGRMTPAEALRSPLRNVITRALGTQSRVTPDIFQLEAEPGDMFLLCSDGLTRELPNQKLESLLSEGLPNLTPLVNVWLKRQTVPAAQTTLPACWCAPRANTTVVEPRPNRMVVFRHDADLITCCLADTTSQLASYLPA
jgi:protein phosphatase